MVHQLISCLCICGLLLVVVVVVVVVVFIIQCPGGSVHPVCVDLADWQKTQAAVKSLGNVDLLVNNAGVTSIESALDVTPDIFDKYVDTSLNKLID